MSKLFFPVSGVWLVLQLVVLHQGVAQQDSNLVILNHADSLIGLEVNGEQARQLVGNVMFTQGRVIVRCNKAIQFIQSRKIELEGDVHVQEDSMRMFGTRGVYYSEEKIAEAFDRVLLEDGLTTLTASYGKYFAREKRAYFKTNVSVQDTGSVFVGDELVYFRETQTLHGDGNVRIINQRNRLTTFGDHFDHDRVRQYSKMTGNPRVVQVDTAGGRRDTLEIRGMILESYQDSMPRVIVTDSVRILRNDLAAIAGSAVFFTKIDSIILQKNPVVWYSNDSLDENQVSGDSIFIQLAHRKLQTVYVRGNAYAISRADSSLKERFNQMSGEEIIMHFTDDKVRQIDVDRTATTLYYLFDEGKPNGANKTTGDHITMTFREGKIDQIKVLAGVEGEYFPEKLVRDRERDHNLNGFIWREDRPVKGRKL